MNAVTTDDIRAVLVALWPDRFVAGECRDEVALGEDGLGLDSVEIAELILACEEIGGKEATDELFAEIPITIERLAGYFNRR